MSGSRRWRETAWRQLLELALGPLDALDRPTRWVLGGGTALALKLHHRVSYDVDIFLEDAGALRDLSPNRNRALIVFSDVGHRAEEILEGDAPREAALVRQGVSSTFTDLGAADVIFDVGGGSTEFVVCEAPPRLVSLNMGTVRLTERIVRHDPPTSAELASVRDAVLEQLARLERFLPARIARLIGVAGTVTTLVTLELELAVYDSARVNGASIERSQIARLEQHLASMPLARRRELVGLDARRADVIVAGAVLVGTVMDLLKSPTFTCRIAACAGAWSTSSPRKHP